MKEGSFQSEIKGIDFTSSQSDDWKLDNVPLPNQVPVGLDFSQIPQNIIKSGVVDALISQNDDLMSRLGIIKVKVSVAKFSGPVFTMLISFALIVM